MDTDILKTLPTDHLSALSGSSDERRPSVQC